MLKLTATKEYSPNPEHYPGCKTEKEMAALDIEAIYDIIIMSLEDGTLDIKIEVV